MLFADLLGATRLDLYVRFDMPVEAGIKDAFRSRLLDRAAGRPTSRILGYREFYGRKFEVDAHVLSPRPETELLVDLGLEFLRAFAAEGRGRARVLEIGVGSGCVIGSLAAEAPENDFFGCDVSPEAIATARRNLASVAPNARADLRHGDLWAPFVGDAPFDLVVSNPPYVSDSEWDALPVEVRDHDPAAALRSGADPASFLRRIADGAEASLAPGGRLAMEGGADLRAAAEEIARASSGTSVRVVDDASKTPRVVVVDRARVAYAD